MSLQQSAPPQTEESSVVCNNAKREDIPMQISTISTSPREVSQNTKARYRIQNSNKIKSGFQSNNQNEEQQ